MKDIQYYQNAIVGKLLTFYDGWIGETTKIIIHKISLDRINNRDFIRIKNERGGCDLLVMTDKVDAMIKNGEAIITSECYGCVTKSHWRLI